MKDMERIYIEKLRKMSAEERLKMAFELCKLVFKITQANIKNENPGISSEDLKKELRNRIYHGYRESVF